MTPGSPPRNRRGPLPKQTAASDHHQPIEDYGIIGDMHSAALVGRNGSIDWFCYPHFDSPSVFARILDDERGGHFQIVPTEAFRSEQYYIPDTNILVTQFSMADAAVEVTDFMPIVKEREALRQHRLIRRVTCLFGSTELQLTCRPRFDYGRHAAQAEKSRRGVTLRSKKLDLALVGDPVPRAMAEGAQATLKLRRGEKATFTLEALREGRTCDDCWLEPDEVDALLAETRHFWTDWISHSTYRGRWREQVRRSALVLKLLTFQPTGAMVAAPTTSLPEDPGGTRNWDYRFTWFRDAAFVVYALLRIGLTKEATAFMTWVQECCRDFDPEHGLQPVYRINGSAKLPERELPWLSGHQDSAPVRIGNGAADQFQLDIYGALLDAVYLFNKHGRPLSKQTWDVMAPMLDWLCDNWERPDRSIWEIRGDPQRFVYSLMMSWVAFDRGIRIALKRSFPADLPRWRAARDAIQRVVYEQGWDPKRRAFVQALENPTLDASLLLMPLVFFVGPDDPQFLATLKAVRERLARGPHVYRYDPRQVPEGVAGTEGTFTMCTFWMIEALTRAGEVDEAHRLFEAALLAANPLGLFAEQVGPTGEFRGNYPQAFTHLALISAAYNLDKRLR